MEPITAAMDEEDRMIEIIKLKEEIARPKAEIERHQETTAAKIKSLTSNSK